MPSSFNRIVLMAEMLSPSRIISLNPTSKAKLHTTLAASNSTISTKPTAAPLLLIPV
ncbi:hypothetical protein LguiB_018080 [Lonicera macranthoides]